MPALGQGEPVGDALQVRLALGRVGVEQIAPYADLRQRDVVLGERRGRGADAVGVL